MDRTRDLSFLRRAIYHYIPAFVEFVLCSGKTKPKFKLICLEEGKVYPAVIAHYHRYVDTEFIQEIGGWDQLGEDDFAEAKIQAQKRVFADQEELWGCTRYDRIDWPRHTASWLLDTPSGTDWTATKA